MNRHTTDPIGTLGILGRMGSMTTRLARSDEEMRLAQSVRHRVFFGERSGYVPSDSSPGETLDVDPYDAHCDHLLVTDHDEVVGTYRLMSDAAAEGGIGFYSQQEFDLAPLRASNPGARLLELGRSCIMPGWRTKRSMELLWAGTWAYTLEHKADILFGCASLPGTDTETLALPLGLLAKTACLDIQEDCPPADGVPLADQISLKALVPDNGVDLKAALKQVPPLLKGYLRLGARVSSHAVVDRTFGTTDVLVVLKVADINPRYINHYGADASRYAAR